MGWSARRTAELNQRGHERQGGISTALVRPGHERHSTFWNPLADGWMVRYTFRDHDGQLFTCTLPTLALCQAARNEWLVKRVADAQRASAPSQTRARALAEAQDAAAILDADLYRDSRTGGYDR